MDHSFNLLNEPWIPVLHTDGQFEYVGILKALTNASKIRQIGASNPMDRVAVIRFLLAILYWCKGNPPDGVNFGNSFPPDWFSKLDTNKDCFNLLGEGKRFYQDRSAVRSRPSTDLLQEIPAGNNFWHFRHSTDRIDGLCPACCAMGLLRLPLFSVSGLPDLKAGINGTPPVYVVPWSKSLLETMLANWKPYPNLGIPAWVQPDVFPATNEDVPLLTGFTLLSRRVWLHDPRPNGRCIGCGSQKTDIIRTCEYQSAGRQENISWNDPHVIYSNATPRKTSKAADLTAAKKFRMDRPWPYLLANIAESTKFGDKDKATSLLVVGFATDKAKNIDVWERTIVLPSKKSIQENSASTLQQWQTEGGRLETRVERSDAMGKAAIAAIRPEVEHRVSAKASALILGDNEAWQQAASEYRPMMEAVGKSLSPGFTTNAVQWRKQIAGTAPDMRPKKEAAKKPGRNKEQKSERDGAVH